MTDTACWSHGQEREASRCYKVDGLTHTPIYAQQTNTQTHTPPHHTLRDNAK